MKLSYALIVVAVFASAGCSGMPSRELTFQERQQSRDAAHVAASGILGAGLGAIIGNQIGSGHPATGAWIGGAAGAATGVSRLNQRGQRQQQQQRRQRQAQDQRDYELRMRYHCMRFPDSSMCW